MSKNSKEILSKLISSGIEVKLHEDHPVIYSKNKIDPVMYNLAKKHREGITRILIKEKKDLLKLYDKSSGTSKLFYRIILEEKYNLPHNHIDFVFHGGSGSSVEEIRESIGYGVVKMNIDTDMQYAFMTGVRDYFADKTDYLQSQIGNPEGGEVPNKKYYDPRVWIRKGEETFVARLEKAFEDLNNVNTL